VQSLSSRHRLPVPERTPRTARVRCVGVPSQSLSDAVRAGGVAGGSFHSGGQWRAGVKRQPALANLAARSRTSAYAAVRRDARCAGAAGVRAVSRAVACCRCRRSTDRPSRAPQQRSRIVLVVKAVAVVVEAEKPELFSFRGAAAVLQSWPGSGRGHCRSRKDSCPHVPRSHFHGNWSMCRRRLSTRDVSVPCRRGNRCNRQWILEEWQRRPMS